MCRSCWVETQQDRYRTIDGCKITGLGLGRLAGAGKNSSTIGVFIVTPASSGKAASWRRLAACFGRPGGPEALLDLGSVGVPGSECEECAIVHGRAERLAVLLKCHREGAVGFGVL